MKLSLQKFHIVFSVPTKTSAQMELRETPGCSESGKTQTFTAKHECCIFWAKQSTYMEPDFENATICKLHESLPKGLFVRSKQLCVLPVAFCDGGFAMH